MSDSSQSAPRDRLATGNTEIDRVLGGGFVHGSIVLISGEPGIGKSTLVAAVAGAVAGGGKCDGDSKPPAADKFSRRAKTESG